ncbi:ORFa1203 [Escherichia coli]|nr:ORFa1203 [Escherichia coli]
MTKNTRFSPEVRHRVIRIVLESQANMTHNGR